MRFLRWWGRTLWDMLPGPIQDALALKPRRETADLHLTATNELVSEKSTAESGGGNVPATLTIESGLCRDVKLPAAAEPDLLRVLEHQIDELTPYRAHQVYLGARVIEKKSGRVKAQLGVAVRSVLDTALKRARAQGYRVERVLLACDGNPLPVSVPGLARSRRFGALPGLRPAHIVLVAFAAALILPLIQKAWHLDDLERKLEDQRASFRADAGSLAVTGDIAAARDILVAEDKAYIPRLTTLAALTEALSDETWLTGLSMGATSVDIQGTTADPSSVLARLGKAATFSDPRFSAPVSRAGTNGLNDFRVETGIEAPP